MVIVLMPLQHLEAHATFELGTVELLQPKGHGSYKEVTTGWLQGAPGSGLPGPGPMAPIWIRAATGWSYSAFWLLL